MRKVLFKKWIPFKKAKQDGSNYESKVNGTGCFESEFTHEGLFHKWGSRYEEFEEGAGNETIAIVELSDGTIKEVLPKNIKYKI